MSVSTYSQYQNQSSSEKIGLVVMEAAKRLVGWSVYSGSIYSYDLGSAVIIAIESNGVALTSNASVTPGTYYYSRETGLLLVQLADSTSPDSKTLALTFKYFFSNVPVALPHDLASGYDVEFLPYLEDSSTFVVEIENTKSLLGVALANSSTIKLYNDQSFWDLVYDSVTFESHSVTVYSWTRDLPVTEAKVIYKGRTANKSYAPDFVSFEVRDFLDELRSPVTAALVSDYVGARVPDNLASARQRTLYGIVNGHVPTPIDQVLNTGYPLTGTLTATNLSATVTGSGTQFLKELSPGDELYIGDSTTKVKVDAVSTDASVTLSEVFAQETQTAVTANVDPVNPKRYANRDFLVAGHALARPAYEVTGVIDSAQFYLDTTDGLAEGDALEFSGSQGLIRVLGDGFVKLVTALASTPSVGSTVYRSSVSNVYLNEVPLALTDDFTYDATAGTLSLTELAEFNNALVQKVSGTVTITNASRNVTGASTQFRTELAIGDWVKLASKTTYFEILDITDDTNLILRTVPGAADAGAAAAVFKNPHVYTRGSVLSCDCLGKADDDGNLIYTAGAISMDLLSDAGLEDELNTSSFTDADSLLPYRLGVAIPAKVSDRNAPSIRDVLNKVCRSSFSSVILNRDFELEMSVLEPSWLEEPEELDESDLLKLEVQSDSSNIVKASRVAYGVKEYDYASGGPLALVAISENDRYLSTTEKEFSLDTILVDQEDAETMASRWAFLLDLPTSNFKIETGLRAARYQVNDVVKLNHEKLYSRFGSSDKARIGAVLSITKGIGKISLLVNDLGNAFSRVARISADDALEYDSAASTERVINGYITDENGLTGESYGINVLW